MVFFPAAVVLGAAAMLVVDGGWGQETVPAASPRVAPAAQKIILRGQVVDSTDRPVAGAGVALVLKGERQPGPALPSTLTDAGGRFELEVTPAVLGFSRVGPPDLLVRDSRQRIGWLSASLTWTQYPASPEGAPVEVRPPIKLLEVRPYSGTLLAASGDPVANATVEAVWLTQRGFPEFRSNRQRGVYEEDALGTPAELQKAWTVRTDGSGRFQLPSLPERGSIVAAVTTGAGVPFLLTWGLDNTLPLRLPATGSLRGRLETAADQEVVSSVRIRLRREALEAANETSFLLDDEKDVTPHADGSFAVDGIFCGDYSLDVNLAGRSDWYADPLPRVAVGPQPDPPAVTIHLRRAAQVRGRVVDARTGHGIAAVSGAIFDQQGKRYVGTVKTNADGNFIIYAPPGKMTISLHKAPQRYKAPGGTRAEFSVGENQPTVTVPDIKLQPGAQVEILVVDRDGKPQPQAKIYNFAGSASGFRPPLVLRADARGRALIEGLDPEDTLSVTVRTSEAVSDGAVVIDPGKEAGPVRVTVAKEHAFSLTGVVHDDRGRPVPGATLTLERHCDRVTRRSVGVLDTYMPDADGRFLVSALWPGDSYRLTISAKGYRVAETSLVPGVAGRTHDFGSITLPAVEGIRDP